VTTDDLTSDDGEPANLIASVCEQYDVDIDTLYAHVAKHHKEANKEKHVHWKPPKGSELHPADPRHMLAQRSEIMISGITYKQG
jgi:hypothetical protein